MAKKQNKAQATSKKADQKKKQAAIEDKTFGLKNKNKSKKVQNYVNQVCLFSKTQFALCWVAIERSWTNSPIMLITGQSQCQQQRHNGTAKAARRAKKESQGSSWKKNCPVLKPSSPVRFLT